MAEIWYYTNDGKQMGPVTTAELKRLAASGSLKPTDLVWKDGMPNWVRASSTRDLFSENGTITAPAPEAISSAKTAPRQAERRGDDGEDRPRRDTRREPDRSGEEA